MATEKTTKKKKKSSDEPAKGKTRGKAEGGSSAAPEDANQPEMRSALLPLIWLLIPFVAVVAYGLLTRE